MILRNYYWGWDKALTDRQCNDIIDKYNNFNSATTLTKDSQKSRSGKVTFTNDVELYRLLYSYVDTANKEAGWNFDLHGAEDIQISKYDKDDHYDWHIDGGSDLEHSIRKDGFVRKLSLVLSLTHKDEYEGGDFVIDLGPHAKQKDIVVDKLKNKGGLVVMPSFLYHKVSPVTKGTRHSLVMWVAGKPFR